MTRLTPATLIQLIGETLQQTITLLRASAGPSWILDQWGRKSWQRRHRYPVEMPVFRGHFNAYSLFKPDPNDSDEDEAAGRSRSQRPTSYRLLFERAT